MLHDSMCSYSHIGMDWLTGLGAIVFVVVVVSRPDRALIKETWKHKVKPASTCIYRHYTSLYVSYILVYQIRTTIWLCRTTYFVYSCLLFDLNPNECVYCYTLHTRLFFPHFRWKCSRSCFRMVCMYKYIYIWLWHN